ncbi:hypothetical protein [Streptomyces platensis]|uniref:hypothetical protein n=1 Tax=Streptomyces platensis TaxID=58346 RepID=UPI00379A0A70
MSRIPRELDQGKVRSTLRVEPSALRIHADRFPSLQTGPSPLDRLQTTSTNARTGEERRSYPVSCLRSARPDGPRTRSEGHLTAQALRVVPIEISDATARAFAAAALALLPLATAPPAHAAEPLSLYDGIEALPHAAESRDGYERTKFKRWIDEDEDGCNTRNEVLLAETVTAQWMPPAARAPTWSSSGCSPPVRSCWDRSGCLLAPKRIHGASSMDRGRVRGPAP